MPSIKTKRIASEMMRVISEILLEDARDNLMKTITITGVDVAADLSFAKVYFTSLSEETHEKLEREMEEASSFIRTELANKMNLRNTPKLKFVYDDSIAYGNNILRILNEINDEK